MQTARSKTVLLGCSLMAAISIGIVPDAIQQAKEVDALASHGVETTGIVTGHSEAGGKGCRLQADIRFEVEGKPYFLVIRGCAADDARLPNGHELKVRYLPENPEVSEASFEDARVRRSTWGQVVGMGGLFLIMVGMLVWEFRKPVAR